MKSRSLNQRKPRPTARRPLKKRRRWSGRHRANGPATILVRNGHIAMCLPRRLKSPNKRGGWHEARGDRLAWEQLLRTASLDTDGSVTLPVNVRMRVAICRLTPSSRYVLDADNLAASAKRLLDSLKECGWLVDDNARFLDGPYFAQALAADKCYWCLISMQEAVAYDSSTLTTVSPQEHRNALLHPPPFTITNENVAPPLTVAETAKKYGLTAREVREVEHYAYGHDL